MEVEICMKARISQVFQKNVEKCFFDVDFQNSNFNPNFSYPKLNFASVTTSVYWPPFLDLVADKDSDSIELSGPFMALLFEISKRLKIGYV